LLISSFESTYSAVLGLAARYAEAQQVAHQFIETLARYRLDFARTYALCAESLRARTKSVGGGIQCATRPGDRPSVTRRPRPTAVYGAVKPRAHAVGSPARGVGA
jgi:hypothetical protein